MCGRTHGQPGLPVTFGFKAAVWAAELDRHLARLRQGRGRWELAQLGGALGTMEFWGEARAEPAGRVRRAGWGWALPALPWLTARDGVAEFVWLLAAIAATVGKIGNEVYQLQRPEIGELQEAFTPGTVGSITMPHKRNPEISEHLVTLSRVVRAQAGLALEGMVAEHERDGRAWKTEWLVVPEAGDGLRAPAWPRERRMLDGLRGGHRADAGQHRRPTRVPAVRAGDALAGRPASASTPRMRWSTRRPWTASTAGQDFRAALRARPAAGRDLRRRARPAAGGAGGARLVRRLRGPGPAAPAWAPGRTPARAPDNVTTCAPGGEHGREPGCRGGTRAPCQRCPGSALCWRRRRCTRRRGCRPSWACRCC